MATSRLFCQQDPGDPKPRRNSRKYSGQFRIGPRKGSMRLAELAKGCHCGRTWPRSRRDQNSKDSSCAARALTFNEPDGARPKLAGQNFCVILPEGLHKKTGSSTLSGARVAQEASEGRPLKLGCATTRRARLLGKCIWGLKFLDRPPLLKTYSKGTQINPKLCFYRICFDENLTEFSVLQS